MKWIGIVFVAIAVSCGNQSNENTHATATDSLVNTGKGEAGSRYARGAKLVAANDCLTCHKLDQKSVGPSYYEVSQKYPFDSGVVENLAHSIINGSKGLYGPAAMTPHPDVSFQDAKAMASYILSLKDSSVTRTTK
jgi:cytochrome c